MPDGAQRVLFVTAEAAPVVKVGGLADVAGALPAALRRRGVDVRIALPAYGAIDARRLPSRSDGRPFPVGLGGEPQLGRVLKASLGEVPVLLLEHAPTFGSRPTVYTDPAGDAGRFTVFAALLLGALAELEWQPDLVHLNDWHAAMLGRWLRALQTDGFDYATLLTIHNLQHQGAVERASAGFAGNLLPGSPDGRVNLLAEGIAAVDAVSTVSPTYAREITTPAYGMGLDPLLAGRAPDLHGIVNGIDTEAYDPVRDPSISARYGPEDPSGKARCKAALQEELDLSVDADLPVLAVVARIVEQKGLDILIVALPVLLASEEFQLIVLGTGDPVLEAQLDALAGRFPERLRFLPRHDAALAQRIYAGADIYVMPSRFEPCGLGQQIAMRYGTLPLVRATGGLVDTVVDLSRPDGVGLRFDEYDPAALRDALRRALEEYRRPERWRAAMVRAMRRDASWDAPARAYVDLYDQTVERHRAMRAGHG